MRMIGRRAFVGAGVASLAGARTLFTHDAEAQLAVPNSSGTAPPKLAAPANAADCHMHVYDATRFAPAAGAGAPPSNATAADYRNLQRRIGTSRVVVVQPRHYATDNEVTVDAVRQLGPGARGIAVLHPTVTDAELRRLDAAGIRGVRFSIGNPSTDVVTADMIEPLARRVAPLGWHVQLNLARAQIVALADLLERLPTTMVFDHMGRPGPAGIAHASHAIVRGLVDRNRAWVKLSGAYGNSSTGPPYSEATPIARAFVSAAAERLVWGSDWPHPTEPIDAKPDDALLFDLLGEWAPREEVRHRILVENAATLYGFANRR
jgi:predicted TIM-barrel fold metal-dependent hydrolase